MFGFSRGRPQEERWSVHTSSDLHNKPFIVKRADHLAYANDVRAEFTECLVLATVYHDASCTEPGGRLFVLESALEEAESTRPLRLSNTYQQQGVRKFVVYCAGRDWVEEYVESLRLEHPDVEILHKIEHDPDWLSYEVSPMSPLLSWPDMKSVEVREEIYAQRVKTANRTTPGFADDYALLRNELLEQGGVSLYVAPGGDASMHSAVNGQHWPTDNPFIARLPNVDGDLLKALWDRSRLTAIGVGYALDDDDVWWPHEWGWASDGRLFETVKAYRSYFGSRLEGDTAQSFIDQLS